MNRLLVVVICHLTFFSAGRHTIERYFYLNDIDAEQYPNGVTVNGANINVQTTDGGTLYNEVHDINLS